MGRTPAERIFGEFLALSRAGSLSEASRSLQTALETEAAIEPPLRCHTALLHEALTARCRLLLERVALHAQQDASRSGVYLDSPDAFEIFIQNGGNVRMYEALAIALSKAWAESVTTGSFLMLARAQAWG